MTDVNGLPEGNPADFVGELEEMNLDELRDKQFLVGIGTGTRETHRFICSTLTGPHDFYEMIEQVASILQQEQLHAKVFVCGRKTRDERLKMLSECTIDYIEAKAVDIITEGLITGELTEKEYTCKAGLVDVEDELAAAKKAQAEKEAKSAQAQAAAMQKQVNIGASCINPNPTTCAGNCNNCQTGCVPTITGMSDLYFMHVAPGTKNQHGAPICDPAEHPDGYFLVCPKRFWDLNHRLADEDMPHGIFPPGFFALDKAMWEYNGQPVAGVAALKSVGAIENNSICM